MTIDQVRVGDILKLVRRPVVVDPLTDYEEIGIRSFGRGIFHKEPISGAALGDKRVFEIHPGELVLSNVFAWEGGIAVSSASDEGKIGSHRFMTYQPVDNSQVDISWAGWFFLSEPGMELIRKASPGSAGRNRTLAVERFAALKVPLPPIAEQRRVAARLQLSSTAMAELEALRRRQSLRTKALVEASVWAVIARGIDGGWPVLALGEVAEINPRPDRPQDISEVTFVPMAAVDEVAGAIHCARTIQVAEAISGYKRFTRGDVIFARITPCMQNGKCAVFDGPHEHGLGSTEFHVLRPGNDVLASWVHRFLRTRHVRDMAAERFTGTAGQQRVPADFLRSVQIPVPPVEVQRAAVVSIDVLLARAQRLTDAVARAQALATAFTPANLNRAFGSSS